MSDSPWNAKRNRRASPPGVQPEAARVNHVPLSAPQDARPKARVKRSAAPQPARPKPEPLAQEREIAREAAPKRPKRRASPLFYVLLFALSVVIAVAAFRYTGSKQRYDALVEARNLEAQRVQAEKNEHLNARENSGLKSLIWKYAREYGVNPSFVSAIIKCESSYRLGQVSSVGARGMMQIMPNTGTWLAGKLNISNYTQDSLDDPETNIRFGTYYLAYLSNMFEGSPVMVASAYHAGDSNAKLWAMKHGEDQKTIRLDQIPTTDTRDYVGKVIKAYAIYFEADQGSPAGDADTLPAVYSARGIGD